MRSYCILELEPLLEDEFLDLKQSKNSLNFDKNYIIYIKYIKIKLFYFY